jgi:hypothetical protein
MLTADIGKILPVILSSFDDTWADVVRVAGAEALREFVIRSTNSPDDFSKLYPAVKERLDVHLIAVRVAAAGILGIYLPKCTSIAEVSSKWAELIIFVDDEDQQIRNSIADLCRAVGVIPQWRDEIVKILSDQQNFHAEAAVLCQTVISELQ